MIRDFQTRNGELLLPEGITRLEGGALAGEGDIRRAVLPHSIDFIGEEVFSGCVKLEEVVLPPKVRELHAAVFSGCESLHTVLLPDELTMIGEGAFLNCTALRQIHLPQALREIRELAFWGTALEEISVGETVELIGDSAFYDCRALKRAEVLNPRADMKRDVFGSCPALMEGYIAPGFPREGNREAELLCSMLWCTCPERHTEQTAERAEKCLRERQAEVMEQVLKQNAVAVMTGLVRRRLLSPAHIDDYVAKAVQRGLTEITALLLQAKGTARDETEEEFAL